MGIAPVQLGLGPVQVRGGVNLRSAGDVKTGRVTENKSGYFTIEDIRKDKTTQQGGAVALASAARPHKFRYGTHTTEGSDGEVKETGKTASLLVSDVLSGSKEAQLPTVDYAILREVKMDGEIRTTASRFLRATSELDVYEDIMEQLRPQWITAAANYTKFPDHYTHDMRMAASERHFNEWMDSHAEHHSHFSEYSPLLALHEDTSGCLDAINALTALHRNLSGSETLTQGERDLVAAKNLVLRNLNNWIVRRTSSNVAITHTDRPGGHVLGFTFNVGGNAYLIGSRGLSPPPAGRGGRGVTRPPSGPPGRENPSRRLIPCRASPRVSVWAPSLGPGRQGWP